MQAILVLLSFIGKFLTSETGAVRQRTSLPLAWAAGVLAGAATLIGATEAKADQSCGCKVCPHEYYCACCPETPPGQNCWIGLYCKEDGYGYHTCSGVC